MPRIIVTDREGNTHVVEGEVGLKVMESLRELSYGVEAICGGMCSCATCHCYIDAKWNVQLPPRQDDELELLEELDGFQDNSRLTCQIEFTEALDGLELIIGPED